MNYIIISVICLLQISNLVAQQNETYGNDKRILNEFLLDGYLDSIKNYFTKKDLFYSENQNLLDTSRSIENYKVLKNKYLALIKKIDLINQKSKSEIEKGYSFFINSPIDYEKTLLGENSILSFDKFKLKIAENKINEATKFLIISQFLETDFKTESMKQFNILIPGLVATLKSNNLKKAQLFEQKLDSLEILLPDSANAIKTEYQLLKIMLDQRKYEESISLKSFQDEYFERDFTLNLGLLLSHASSHSISFSERYFGPNEAFYNKLLDYSYKIPPNAGIGFTIAFDYNLYNSLFLGFDYNFFNYNYSGISVRIDNSYKNWDWNGLNTFSFTDISISSKSYHIYLQYKFTNKTIFHPFLKIAYGKAYTERSGNLPNDPSDSQLFYNESLYNILHNGSAEFNELEVGLGVEVLKIISNKILVSCSYTRDVKFGSSEWSKISAGKFTINLGYAF